MAYKVRLCCNNLSLIWIIQCILVVSLHMSLICKPAEENKEHTLSFKWRDREDFTTTKLTIQRNNIVVSICNTSTSCFDFFPSKFKTITFVNKTILDVTVMIHLFNVSRSAGHTWLVVKNGKLIKQCTLFSFTKADSISCKANVSLDGLIITCWSSQIYPEAKCKSNLKMTKDPSYLLYTWIEITNERIPGDLTFYEAVCHITAPVDQIDPGIYEVYVKIYPNVTGTDMDLEYGTNHFFFISLDQPRIKLKHCAEIVVEHAKVSCECERSDSSLINTSIVWSRNNGSQTSSNSSIINNGSLILFTASRKTTGYICRALNAFNWTGIEITASYSPNVIAPVKTICCDKNQSQDYLTASCRTNNIYPEAECRFLIVYNVMYYVFTNYKITRNTLQISHDPIYYETTCTLHLSKRNLSQGVYDVDVIMYPNVIGNDSDLQFGTQTKFSFKIDPAENTTSFSTETMIVTIVTGTICIILILCLIFNKKRDGKHLLENCLKCTEDKSLNYGYDEINDGYIVANQDVYEGEQNTGDGIIVMHSAIHSQMYVAARNVENQDYDDADEIFESFQNLQSDDSEMQQESDIDENICDDINIVRSNDIVSLSRDETDIAKDTEVNITHNV